MPRYARMLEEGMKQRGYSVELWAPRAFLHRFGKSSAAKKWLGYVDQFLVFPLLVKWRLRQQPAKTLYAFADQALGPWVPLVADLPHVIHCHDFLAQRSALDEFPVNPTSRTGKIYQAYIRKGYTKGKNFISVSEKTRADLHRILGRTPEKSRVVYNGLNQQFLPTTHPEAACDALTQTTGIPLKAGFLLHVGGNVWYKNRLGVLEIYEQWRAMGEGTALPLLMIGEAPTEQLAEYQKRMKFGGDVYFLSKVADAEVRLAYQAASAFLFPSLEEGFGWPIAEAMASGCLVLTTAAAPMTEVAGAAAELIPQRQEPASAWAITAAKHLQAMLSLSPETKAQRVAEGIDNASRFDPERMLNEVAGIYAEVLQAPTLHPRS